MLYWCLFSHVIIRCPKYQNVFLCSVVAETAEGVEPFSHVVLLEERPLWLVIYLENTIFVDVIYLLASEPQTTSFLTENLFLYPVISAVGSVIILVIVIIVSIIKCTKFKQRIRKHWYQNNYTYFIDHILLLYIGLIL